MDLGDRMAIRSWLQKLIGDQGAGQSDKATAADDAPKGRPNRDQAIAYAVSLSGLVNDGQGTLAFYQATFADHPDGSSAMTIFVSKATCWTEKRLASTWPNSTHRIWLPVLALPPRSWTAKPYHFQMRRCCLSTHARTRINARAAIRHALNVR